MSNWNEMTMEQTKVGMATRNILRNVYIWMAVALGITAVVAYGVAQNESFVVSLYQSGAIWAILIAKLVIVFVLGRMVMKMQPIVAVGVFALFAVLMGIGLSSIFIVYEIGSIFKAFMGASIMFGVMTVYGLTTKRDLTSWGTFLHMALIGLVIASLINVFLGSTTMDYVVSFIGIIIFTGLTAYDTQKIKQMSQSLGSSVTEPDYIRLSILGALELYLDFINIFLFLLRFFGSSRD